MIIWHLADIFVPQNLNIMGLVPSSDPFLKKLFYFGGLQRVVFLIQSFLLHTSFCLRKKEKTKKEHPGLDQEFPLLNFSSAWILDNPFLRPWRFGIQLPTLGGSWGYRKDLCPQYYCIQNIILFYKIFTLCFSKSSSFVEILLFFLFMMIKH